MSNPGTDAVTRAVLVELLDCTAAEFGHLLRAGLPRLGTGRRRRYPLREALEWVAQWATKQRAKALPGSLRHTRASYLMAKAELAALYLAVREGRRTARLRAEARIQHMEGRTEAFMVRLTDEAADGLGLSEAEVVARIDAFVTELREEMGISRVGPGGP